MTASTPAMWRKDDLVSRLRTLRTVSLLLCVLLMISIGPPAARAAGPEQIVNGGFDNAMVGWTAYPTSSVIDGQGCISVPAGHRRVRRGHLAAGRAAGR